MPLTADDVDRFEASRHRLQAIAYRLLGSAGEAEDDHRREDGARKQAVSQRGPKGEGSGVHGRSGGFFSRPLSNNWLTLMLG